MPADPLRFQEAFAANNSMLTAAETELVRIFAEALEENLSEGDLSHQLSDFLIRNQGINDKLMYSHHNSERIAGIKVKPNASKFKDSIRNTVLKAQATNPKDDGPQAAG